MLIEDKNYTLEWKVKAGVRPDGKDPASEYKWVLGGYFATLDQLLLDYVASSPSHQNDGKIKSLQDVCKVIQDAEATIKKLIHK